MESLIAGLKSVNIQAPVNIDIYTEHLLPIPDELVSICRPYGSLIQYLTDYSQYKTENDNLNLMISFFIDAYTYLYLQDGVPLEIKKSNLHATYLADVKYLMRVITADVNLDPTAPINQQFDENGKLDILGFRKILYCIEIIIEFYVSRDMSFLQMNKLDCDKLFLLLYNMGIIVFRFSIL